MRKIYNRLVILAFSVFFIYGFIQILISRKNYKADDYYGIITDIKHFKGDRGNPSIKVQNNWISLGPYGGKIQNYIQIGDSIVKKSGTPTIIVYRTNNYNDWEAKVFP